ncbi:hypothetical protein [Paenibacillus campi]|uniref:hypothetical protein n=1 Tax=Paenibacillus campi TaxID=3106031 RepID=UPI002AFFC4B4|nr:hypothetical protein [Paenibacillus sp. SGZ-1014]
MKYKRLLLSALVILMLTSTGLLLKPSTAHAGWWEDYKNGIRSFTELPQEVQQLKQNYDQAMTELDEAKQNMQSFRDENKRLAEQNELLTQTVKQLQQAEAERAASARFWKTLLFSAIGIVLLWFIFTRLVRFGLRRR